MGKYKANIIFEATDEHQANEINNALITLLTVAPTEKLIKLAKKLKEKPSLVSWVDKIL